MAAATAISKKASDYVDHDAIFEELAATKCRPIMYNYVKAFLQERILTIAIGDHKTGPIPHPQRGIPHGAVLSPTLFTLATLKIHRALSQVEDIKHFICADDVTIWSTTGSPGHIQTQLQEALNRAQQAATTIGLPCSAEKRTANTSQQTVETSSH
ncbi:hypothetical protein HPB48_018545 [Haemaphysalis longicornis]|uniref:Reverse transcriptase domain-containing protein n=1 Tax=Haemaphysalis longicornis TaxID=44386 RepID=A0A9J6FVY0_HAELO|nr:hypothetical protein HPB48_018545 [Haemaphysalis longicornis]